MLRPFEFLRTDDLPADVRPNYVAELQYAAFWVLLASTIEVNLNTIVAQKTFGAGPLLGTVVWSIPVVANLLNVGWAVVLRGVSRVRAMTWLCVGISLGVISLALTPADWGTLGACIYAGQLACIYLLFSGLITARTSLWQANYPPTHRGRASGRLQMVRLLATLIVPVALGALYDKAPGAYRVVYPVAGCCGLLAVLFLRRIHTPNEEEEIAEVHARLARERLETDSRWSAFMRGVRDTRNVMRKDALYRNYMIAQFMLGGSNFFTEPLLAVVVPNLPNMGYFGSAVLLTQIRTLMNFISTPAWSRLFERVSIFRFRVINSGFWLAAQAAVGLTLLIYWLNWPLYLVIAVLVLARMLAGVGHGAGMLAWPLGHLAFSRGSDANLYLGVHVTLTGLRSLLMPALAYGLAGVSLLAAAPAPVLLVTGAHLMFRVLSRYDRVIERRARQAARETLPRTE